MVRGFFLDTQLCECLHLTCKNTCCVTLLNDIKKVFPGLQGMALAVDCYFFLLLWLTVIWKIFSL